MVKWQSSDPELRPALDALDAISEVHWGKPFDYLFFGCEHEDENGESDCDCLDSLTRFPEPPAAP